MKKTILAFSVLCMLNAAGQNKAAVDKKQTAASLKFNSTVQFGLLEGEAPSAFQAQAINGIQYKTWGAGIGVGIDNYMFRTIPLFIELRKNILNKATTPYVFTSVGLQFPWVRNNQKLWYGKSDFNTGIYYNLGLGYRINMFKNNALLFSTAFSLKQITNTIYVSGPGPCYLGGCPEDIPQPTKYTLRRLSLQIGWNF